MISHKGEVPKYTPYLTIIFLIYQYCDLCEKSYLYHMSTILIVLISTNLIFINKLN